MATTPDTMAAPTDAAPPDIINQLAGIVAGSPLARLREERPVVVRHAQGSYETLLEPADPAGVSRDERDMIALRVALVTPGLVVAAWHRTRLRQRGVAEAAIAAVEQFPNGGAVSPRLAAILRQTDQLTLEPAGATAAHIADLKAAGLSARDIVTIAQLIAFISFQVRTLAALRVLAEPAPVDAVRRSPANVPARHGFTIEAVPWRPWLATVDDVGADEEQTALLGKIAAAVSGRGYYALLVHDAPVLRERTELFNAIMYGPGGLRRADRELGAVAASRVNGCVYCASVHARRYVQLTKETASMQRLLDEGVGAAVNARERALVDYSVLLTMDPAGLQPVDLAPLRQQGLADGEMLDLAHAVAMFAWANRLLLTLGEIEVPAA